MFRVKFTYDYEYNDIVKPVSLRRLVKANSFETACQRLVREFKNARDFVNLKASA